ncbi:MAG: fibronectin type III domain-containing protein [Candidatus Doudnabacteria bacterium]|nr:fibronectin type III domain-containing protein [Candidatus Doudnabacteria bacterium]
MPGKQPEQSNSGVKRSISWGDFDAQINRYRSRKVSQRVNPIKSLGLLLWSVPKYVFSWFKVYEPRWRTILAMILLVTMLGTLFFFNSKISQAASYTFVQTDWSGGVSGSNASHSGNQTGWTNYSAQTNADTSTSGTSKVAAYTNSVSETFDTTTNRDAANTTAAGTITRVNTVTNHLVTTGSTVSTSATNHTTGNAIVMSIGWEDVNRTNAQITISDTAGNTYTKLTQSIEDGAHGLVAYSCNITGNANNVVTINFGVNVPSRFIFVAQYSGLATSNCLDQQNINTIGSSPSTNLTTQSITTTQANELIFIGIKTYDSTSYNPGTGYTEIHDIGDSSTVVERIVSSTGTFSSLVTSSISTNFSATIASFKARIGTWEGTGQLVVPGSSGTANAQSVAVDSTTNNIKAATLTKNDTPGTGTVTYFLSNDGSTFTQVTAGSPFTFAAAGSSLKFKIVLTGNATVQDVSISYNGFQATADLTSSAYNTIDSNNLITKLAWTASGTTGSRTIQFQVRSAPNNAGSPGTWSSWCGYADCSGSTFFSSSDNNVALSGSHPLRTGTNDQWLQYKIFFATDGLATPSVDDVTISYVINTAPEFDPDYPTTAAGGVSASQVTNSASSDYGKVLINYRIRDTDTTNGQANPGFVTPTFEYNIGGGWISITSGFLGATDLANKAVSTSSYTTYTATWNAQSQIANNYTATAQVRVNISDNEAANATATATSASFVLDTKVPAVSSFIANSATDKYTLTATDDTNLQYRISNNSDLSADGINGTSGQWQSAGGNSISINPSWVFAGSPNEQIYYQVRDTAGNLTAGSAKIPVTVTSMDIKDISNQDSSNFREFVSWGVYSSVAGATFANYKVYVSTDGSSYSLESTITDININYYADFTLDGDLTYSYKVLVTDTNGDISAYSEIVSDQPNGQGGSDTTPPSISDVTVTETQSTYVTITWTTDELSDSRVDYSLAPSTSFNAGSTSGVSYVTSHSVTITGLTPNTAYLFRVQSQDVLSNVGTDDNGGAGYSFSTTSGPIISNVTESSVNDNSATIFWTTNVDSDSHVSYSTSSNLSSPTTVGSNSLVGGSNPYQHEVTITGLTAGRTYYYQVTSKDALNNTSINNNGGNYYSFVTTTDTVAPIISNVDSPVIAPTAGVVVWQTNELANSKLEYGTTTGDYDVTTTLDTTLSIFHIVAIDDLDEETTYYYRVISKDAAGNETISDEFDFTTGVTTIIQQIIGGGGGGGGSSVVLDTTAPTINNIKTEEIGTFSAKVTFDTNEDAVGLVMYGTDENKLTLNSSAFDYGKTQIATLSGLRMGTDYFFKTKAFDKAGNVTTSQTAEKFTTKFLSESNITIDDAEQYREELENAIESALPSLVPPFIENPKVTEVTDSSAKITWRTNVATFPVVEYATDNEYVAGAQNPYAVEVSDTSEKSKDHEIILQNLNPNTQYHFRAKGFSLPRLIGTSKDLTFITKALNIQAQIGSITNNSFRVTWRTSDPTSSVVEYRNTKTGVLNQKAIEELATSHEISVDALTPATTYEVTVYGINSKGNKVQTATAVKITTSIDTKAPEILSLKIDTALIPGRNDRTQTIVSWKTTEPSTSTVYYEEGGGTSGDEQKTLANKVEITNSFVLDHAVVISVLKPGGLYRIQVGSTDSAGNTVTLPVKTIVVPRQSESILDVVFKNFEDTFKFLRQIGK